MDDRVASAPTTVNSSRAPWTGAARNGVCPACRAELADPRSRRFRYPFIACPECGPGYTITMRLPFARVNTTLAPFEPCEDCWQEFEDPSSRYFGSATVCCPDCGPAYWIEPAPPIDDAVDVIDSAVRGLRDGSIYALKDTCSFRFVVRATDAAAVQRLRRRLDQPDLAFGVMVADLDMARTIAHVTEDDARVLEDPSAPQVVMRRCDDAPWLDAVTASGGEVAVMLPRAPVHFMLLEAMDEPLVVVRAAPSDDVVVLENEDARRELMDVVDALMLHDLDLHAGCEDSQLRIEDGVPVVLRRASGYAPRPLDLGRAIRPMVAIGGTHDVSIALVSGGVARLGAPVGDPGTARATEGFRRAFDRMLDLWECVPEWIVADPESQSTAAALAAEHGAQTILVDHHHAHVASVLAEHRIDGRVLGVSLDSSGRVVDPELGAARFLLVEGDRCRVVQRMPAFRVPGADAAPRDPWRIAVGLLHDLGGPDVAEAWARRLVTDDATADSALSMLAHDVGCVPVHSFGKLFDVAAALLGVARRTASPGTAARRLQLLAGPPDVLTSPEGEPDPADFLATWLEELLDRARADGDPTADARWVQRSLSGWIARWAFDEADAQGLPLVAASGGCFDNPWLRAGFRAEARLRGAGLALNHEVPSGDSGLAIGQIWVAACGRGALD